MADGGESDVASANAFVFSEKGDASPGEGTETTISSRIWARRRARDRVWIARTHLNPGGEVHGSFHGDAVHGVEHHAQVVGGGDEHPGHLSGQAEHTHAVFGVGLRLRPREQVDGVRLSLRSRRARDIGKGTASEGDRTETRVAAAGNETAPRGNNPRCWLQRAPMTLKTREGYRAVDGCRTCNLVGR